MVLETETPNLSKSTVKSHQLQWIFQGRDFTTTSDVTRTCYMWDENRRSIPDSNRDIIFAIKRPDPFEGQASSKRVPWAFSRSNNWMKCEVKILKLNVPIKNEVLYVHCRFIDPGLAHCNICLRRTTEQKVLGAYVCVYIPEQMALDLVEALSHTTGVFGIYSL